MKRWTLPAFFLGLLLAPDCLSAGNPRAGSNPERCYRQIPFGAPIVFAGDSIVAHGFVTDSKNARSTVRAFGVWALILARHPFAMTVHSNAGVGGNTSTQLLARYGSDVAAYKPQVVVLLIGTNDLGGIVPAETTISNIAAMLAKNREIGAFTFLLKILPRGNGALKARQMGPPMLRDWNKINEWIGTQDSHDVCAVDCEPELGNMDPAHTVKDGMTSDCLHPNQRGAYVIGSVLLQAFAKTMTPGEVLFATNNAAENYVPNGFMTGAGGAAISASGQVADSWTGSGASAGGASVAFSKVPRPDGYGEWQQMEVEGSYSGKAKFARIFRTMNLAGQFKAGDIVQLACEIEVDEGAENIAAFTLSGQSAGVNLCVNNRISNSLISPETATANAWKGVCMTPPFVLTDGLGLTTVEMDAFMADAEAATPVKATVRYGRCQLAKLQGQ